MFPLSLDNLQFKLLILVVNDCQKEFDLDSHADT